jgi:hypothetical protein
MPAKKKSRSKKRTPAAPKRKASKVAKSAPSARSYSKAGRLSTGRLRPVKAQEIKTKYIDQAYKFSAARRKDVIHPRKVIPKAPVGPKVMDAMPTAPMAMEEGLPVAALSNVRAAPMTPMDTITIVTSVQLNDVATADTASHVCEPSVAVNGKVVFYTGNWFAALSVDGGSTFKFVDPFSTFPDPPGMGFCCDQIALYIKSIDTFVWLLQYTEDASGKNIHRIAYATTAKIKTGTWKFFDITPASLGLGAGIWLDFPDLALGTNMLYVTTNAFAGGTWKASVVVRIKLSSFTSGTLSASRSLSNTHPSLRVAQNCGTTAYFVAHNSTSSLRVFTW